MRMFAIVTTGLLAISAPANAAVVFSDSFDGENGGASQLNYAGYANWSVLNGSTDLIRSGNFGITCRGAVGSCVDLDGSTSNGGDLRTVSSFGFAAGDFVEISFWISGNQRGGASDQFRAAVDFASNSDALGAQLGGAWSMGPVDLINVPVFQGTSAAIAPGAAFAEYKMSFSAGNAGSFKLTIGDLGANNVGVILDDVSISITPRVPAVPEPASWALMIAGFGLVGFAARRRKLALS